MANVTITDLPAAGPITGTESVPIVQNGQTVQTTTAAIAASPSQTQTFLTINQEPTLPNSRYLSSGTGLGLTDGGAQSYYRIVLNGASGSLETASTGIIAKTDASTVAARTLATSGAGLSVSNGDGVGGNPTFQLTGLVAALANASPVGLLVIRDSSSVSPVSIAGVSDQTIVINGNGFSGNPTVGLADNPIIPGTGAMTVPVGTTGQQPGGSQGQIRYNTTDQSFWGYASGQWRQFSLAGGVTLINTGNGLTGGPITSTGTISIDTGVVATLTGTQTLTNKTISGSSNTLSNIGNSSLTNSSLTVNGTSISLGGSETITAATPYNLTVGTGLQLDSGSTFNGSAARTISIDSTVATLTGSQTLTNKTISGASNTLSNIGNSSLTNSSVTYNGTSVSLGGSGTITANTTNAVTFNDGGSGVSSGTTFDGSVARTISYNTVGASPLAGSASLTTVGTITTGVWNGTAIGNNYLANSSLTIGTTTISLGGTSLTLAGLTSVTVTQDPTSALQLATKQYVDAVTEGLHIHASCAAATPSSLATITGGTVTYNNGSSGVGATLTLSVALTTLDGYALQNGNRVLVKNESNQAYNGIYTWATGGTVLTRATDFDTITEVASGDYTFVTYGTLYASTGWVQTNPTTAIGTSPINFVQFSGAGTYTAGTGLTLTGTQFSITNTGVSANSYGSASSVGTFTVNAQGQLTSAATIPIAIANTQVSGLGTMSTQNANSVAITGGAIDGTTIGGTTPAAGTFTTLTANSTFQAGKSSANYVQAVGAATTLNPVLSVVGSDTNVSMVLQPQGTGAVDLAAGSKGVNISNGGTVTALTRTAFGSNYTSIPSVTISPPTTAGGVQATANAQLSTNTPPTIVSGGTGYTVNDILTVVGGTGTAVQFTVATVSGGVITALNASNTNVGTYSVLPTNPVSVTGGTGTGATFNLSGWYLSSAFTITNAGSGYVEQPTVSFSGGGGSGAAAYATVGSIPKIQTLGSAVSFYTPGGEQFRVNDSGSNAVNYWQATGGATTSFALLTATGSDTNVSGALVSKGTGALIFSTNNASSNGQMRVAHTASAVNYVQVTGGSTTNSPIISAQGSDTNVALGYTSKGTGNLNFFTNTANSRHLQITHVAGTLVNYVTVSGSAATAAPAIAVAGTDTDIDLTLTPKGAGLVRFGAYTAGAPTATGYISIKSAAGVTYKVLVST